MQKISGGYYIKARAIQESEISTKPPHFREIWDWLIKECNHADKRSSGILIKRGQCLRSYKDIQEGLHWMVGWRKEQYSKNDCESAMKWLKAHTMVHTMKTTRGMLITIVNYNTYQNPNNYEAYSPADTKHTRSIQTTDTINKNDKNEKNKESSSKVILAKWNELAEARNLKKIKALTSQRKDKFNTRSKEPNFDYDKILSLIKKSAFLCGSNDRGWKIDFDWLVYNDTNYNKILEGKYDNKVVEFK